jgi:hypothetical protein
MGTFSPYSRPGMIAKNISNYMTGNPGTSLGLTALGAMMGMPGLGVMNAVNSVYGGGSSGSSTGSEQVKMEVETEEMEEHLYLLLISLLTPFIRFL